MHINNFDAKYYTCFTYRTLGSILRNIYPDEMYMTGKGFSISELIQFLISKLRRDNKKLLLVIDEVQNLSTEDLIRCICRLRNRTTDRAFAAHVKLRHILATCRRQHRFVALIAK